MNLSTARLILSLPAADGLMNRPKPEFRIPAFLAENSAGIESGFGWALLVDTNMGSKEDAFSNIMKSSGLLNNPVHTKKPKVMEAGDSAFPRSLFH
jgi:hypothetical protein